MRCPLSIMAGLRWAFNFTTWKPLQTEWMFSAQCIQPEEKQRISQFMFQKDAKAAMVGKLFLLLHIYIYIYIYIYSHNEKSVLFTQIKRF